MGRKNKAKTNRRLEAAAAAAAGATPAATNGDDDLAYLKQRRQLVNRESETPIFPPKPNMCLDPSAIQRKLLSLPPTKRSATAERLIRANVMMMEIDKLQADREERYDDGHVDIDILKTDRSYMRECVLWIKAFISSNFRLGFKSSTIVASKCSPLPLQSLHITQLFPLTENETQLMNLDALSFVIMLAAAMRLGGAPHERFSLQIVHELHAHAERMHDCLDFHDLQSHEETKDLDEPYLRFALAWVGIKRARAMYRNEDNRTMMPFHRGDDAAIQSKSLLRSIELFAREQCQYNPDSPVGLWNLGWFTTQVKHNGKQRWEAAVEFYNLMSDCCILANEADDDFYRAEAGVECAMGLILGGKPIVGYSVKSGAKVQVLRDFDLTWEACQSNGGDLQMPIGAPSTAAAHEASVKEMNRLKENVTPTLLEPGETVIVPHWEVSRIWNFAMQAFMRLEIFDHGSYVYGETIGWDIGEAFLKGKYGQLAPNRYNTCPQVGFKGTRDKGSFSCDFSGKIDSNLQNCARCKKTQYCSRKCQKDAWKTHKPLCVTAN